MRHGPGAHEAFARHCREGLDHALVKQMAGRAEILGEPAPHLVECRVERGRSAGHDQSFRTCIWIGPSARPWMNCSTWALPERSISATGPCQISVPS